MRLLVPLAILLAGALIASGAAAAQPFTTWKRNPGWSQEPRELDVSLDPAGFVVESARAGADEVLVGRFNLRTAEYRLELRNQSGEGSVQSMRVTLTRLIEFRDGDDDGAYEATDAIVRVWSLQDVVVPSIEDARGRDGSHRVTATYDLGAADGPSPAPKLDLVFLLSPHVQSMAGVPILPTETKFDIHIQDAPYNATDSRLAVEFQVQTTGPARLAPNAMRTESGEYRFEFGWQPTATVDGRATRVGLSVVPTSPTLSGVYLSYARGDEIVHDPSVGVHRYEETMLAPLSGMLSKGSAWLYLAGIIGAAIAIGVATHVRARRRE